MRTSSLCPCCAVCVCVRLPATKCWRVCFFLSRLFFARGWGAVGGFDRMAWCVCDRCGVFIQCSFAWGLSRVGFVTRAGVAGGGDGRPRPAPPTPRAPRALPQPTNPTPCVRVMVCAFAGQARTALRRDAGRRESVFPFARSVRTTARPARRSLEDDAAAAAAVAAAVRCSPDAIEYN